MMAVTLPPSCDACCVRDRGSTHLSGKRPLALPSCRPPDLAASVITARQVATDLEVLAGHLLCEGSMSKIGGDEGNLQERGTGVEARRKGPDEGTDVQLGPPLDPHRSHTTL